MLNALGRFQQSIADARAVAGLYDALRATVPAQLPLTDLLRYQLVYSVSALDKLMHDLVRIGMVRCFVGSHQSTSQMKAEKISLDLHQKLVSTIFPPKEYLFEQAIYEKLSHISYQDPDNIAKGLSFIWHEPHKWQVIASKLNSTERDTKTRLKLIVTRRNAIVHEADTNPVTNAKVHLSRDDCCEMTEFIHALGVAITQLVL